MLPPSPLAQRGSAPPGSASPGFLGLSLPLQALDSAAHGESSELPLPASACFCGPLPTPLLRQRTRSPAPGPGGSGAPSASSGAPGGPDESRAGALSYLSPWSPRGAPGRRRLAPTPPPGIALGHSKQASPLLARLTASRPQRPNGQP
ncbi:hypothetical protein NDU88_005183 [Pleurodeles waltl]|uniref:Uncharacterized protein n=1 Tax=Pleurodeles waltl TaxID=8319 RepID=A0AAV7TUQ3_PLEWA|nr:hypothetical protein NDU88_005183 [Pleurodeles waltl]